MREYDSLSQSLRCPQRPFITSGNGILDALLEDGLSFQPDPLPNLPTNPPEGGPVAPSSLTGKEIEMDAKLQTKLERKPRRGRGEDFNVREDSGWFRDYRRYPCGCVYSYNTRKWKTLCGKHGESNPL